MVLFAPGRAAAQKAEVFIYYANENSPDETELANYRTIIEWLRTSSTELAQDTADSLERDVRLFSAAVDLETETIRRMFPKSETQADAVIFTNRLVREGKYLVFRRGDRKFREVKIEPPRFENYIVTSNPLCDPEVFARMLHEVAQQFNPAERRFVLVTKSHGSKLMSLTPRLAVRFQETSRDEILAVVERRIPKDRTPSWVGKLGTKKETYLAVLANAGRLDGMKFRLVCMESCDGGMSDELKAQLPENVERLCVIDKYSANYINLLYGDILQQDFATATLADVVNRFLSSKFTVIAHKVLVSQQPSSGAASWLTRYGLVCLVPLFVWISLVVVWRYRARKKRG